MLSISLSNLGVVGGRRRVLIVEDDPALRGAMQVHVERMEVDVVVASHYEEARACLSSMPCDLACIDIGLPTESGYELCELIRGPLGLWSMPVLVMSAFAGPHERAFAEEAGANVFLAKPFSMRALGSHVTALLDGAWPSVTSMCQLGLMSALCPSPAQRRWGAHRLRTLAATPAAIAATIALKGAAPKRLPLQSQST
jgi:DNA-binding response OmpR family regulator